MKCIYCGEKIPAKELKNAVACEKDGEKKFAHRQCFAQNIGLNLFDS